MSQCDEARYEIERYGRFPEALIERNAILLVNEPTPQGIPYEATFPDGSKMEAVMTCDAPPELAERVYGTMYEHLKGLQL